VVSVTIHPFMRPDDADAFRQALRRARQHTGVPLVFGGQVTDRVLRLSEFLGARTNALRGLNVMPGTGLGGYVVAHRHPLEINDYERANTITHDYDDPVLAEGIRSITAAPITVRGTVRGVLYAAVRSVFPLGNRATSTLLEISRQLAGEIAIRDEVDRRIQLLEAAASSPPTAPEASPGREALRDLYTEFRSIALQLQDTELRGRLLRACDRFARVGVNSPHSAAVAQPSLSPRELDVLSYAALGCSNAEIAERLSLLPETVKAYLRSATRKLGVHGRNQAVVAARRQGLLPLRDDRTYCLRQMPCQRQSSMVPVGMRDLPVGCRKSCHPIQPGQLAPGCAGIPPGIVPRHLQDQRAYRLAVGGRPGVRSG
jgi:DNA-binding CsgD family transcriptional regulator